MKRKVMSRSGLFLLEMMISILFFSIAAAVCVQVFAKAHTMSREAQDLNMAVSCASSAAEGLTHLTSMEAFGEAFPEAQETADGVYCLYYDQDWMNCAAEQAYARMEILVTEEEQMRYGTLNVWRAEETEPLYSLEVSRYLQEEVAHE